MENSADCLGWVGATIWAMQWLNVSYSVWFNRRPHRSAHLLQGRFKAGRHLGSEPRIRIHLVNDLGIGSLIVFWYEFS